MKKYAFIILLFLLFIIPANAQTGYLNVSTYVNKYHYTLAGTAGVAKPPQFDHAYVLNSAYDTMDFFAYLNTVCTLPYVANSTTFTITSGAVDGLGNPVTGTVSYNTILTGNEIRWIFTHGTAYLTSNRIEFSYTDSSIFTGYSCPGADFTSILDGLTTNTPMALGTADVNTIHKSVTTGSDEYTFNGASSTTLTWNITYPGQNYFNLIVGKNSTKTTKVYVYNQSGISYFFDAVFNSNNFTVFTNNTGKIIMNATLSSGGTNSIILNNSGPGVTPVATPIPSPTPPTIPSGQQAAIDFNQNSYNIGGVGLVTTNINFDLLDINSYRVDFYSTQNPLISQFAIDKSQASQTFAVQFPTEDVYTANIVKSVPIIGDFIIANDTAQAVKGSASIQVPLTVAVGKNFTVYYTYNYQPNNEMCGLGGNGLFAVLQSDGSIKSQNYLFNQTQGTNYSINLSVPTSGTYILQIRDCSQGIVGTSIPFNAVVMSVVPQFNITTSYITLDQDTYYSGDVITGQYGVDNFNYSNYVIYYELDNWTNGVILKNPLSAQKGAISQITDGYDLINLMLVTGMIPNGVNKVALRASNGTSDFEIAYDNFTFSTVTAAGYDISVDKTCVNTGDSVKIHVVAPAGVSAEMVVVRSSDNSKVTYAISNTTTISYYPSKVDNYVAMIKDAPGNLGNVQKSVTFTMSAVKCSGGAPGTVTPTTTTSSGVQKANDIANLLDSNLFWALIFTACLMIGVAVALMNRQEP